jgi:hypothetical protein
MKIGIVLFAAAFVLCSPFASWSAESRHPDLTGQVLTDENTPLKGATVFIYTAGPKVGLGTI